MANLRNFKYQKNSSPYSYVAKLLSYDGEERWVALFKKIKLFETEREAALFVDKICIEKGIEPKNILNRVIHKKQ